MLRFFLPPKFADEERTHTARLLYVILWTLILVVTPLEMLEAIALPEALTRWLSIIIVIDLTSLVLLVLTYRGYTRWASIVLVLELWALLTVLALTAGGIQASAVTAYLIVVFAAGLLLGGWAGILTAALCSLSELGMVYAEMMGFLPSKSLRHNAFTLWLSNTLYLLVIISLQYLATRTIKDALLRARQDLLERQRIEAALRESEERFRLLAENSTDLISRHTLEGVYLYVSPACRTLLGYEPEELVEHSVYEFFHPDDLAAITKSHTTIFEQPVPYTISYRIRRKDGAYIWFETISRTIRDEQMGVVMGFQSTSRDITEKKRAEETLRASEEKYRKFFEEDLSGVYVSTPEGRLLACNPTFAQIFGFASVQDALATNVISLFPHPQAREGFLSSLRKRKKLERYESELCRRDGSPIYLVENAFGVFNDQGELVEIKGYLFDDTERKKLEQQLLQAQKMEAVGRLAGGVAHDFNNMLTVITGYADLFLTRVRDSADPWRKPIEEIKKAGERASLLTRQLLAFSRRQVLEPKVLDLNAVVSEMEKMLRRLIGEDVDLQFVPHSALGPVEADPGQIGQVIMNLVVNSRDAMPGGGKLIIETTNVELDEEYARMHAGAKPGDYVMLAVSDTGCGMSAEVQSHIFEPFFTTKEKGKGTGLGLSTVYGIIKQSGGHISVYTEEGHGTTFKVYLPRVKEAVETLKTAVVPPEQLQGSETILLVEDDVAVRALALEILRMKGYTVLEAMNGNEAIQICQAHKGTIDLLITDAVMPMMGGRELANKIASLRPTTKILFISGYTEQPLADLHGLKNNAPFLQKPFTPEKLARKVRDVLDH